MEIKLKTGILSLEKNDSLDKLIGFSSRINKKRGFLFVSKVLGKHIPASPASIKNTHKQLAKLLIEKIDNKNTLFIGFAETATGIGNGVFEEANLPNSFYIHTTRYQLSSDKLLEFQEEHCHAPSHILYKPLDQKILSLLETIENIVLVDDEITTGNTLNNIVEVLKSNFPQVKKYYCVSIISWLKKPNPELEYISLYHGSFDFKAEEIIDSDNNIVSITSEQKDFDEIMPHNFGRFGIQNSSLDYSKIIDYNKYKDQKVLVLGTGEFMYQAYKLADYLEQNGIEVFVQSTTRSPVNIDYDIDSKIQFKDNYGEKIDNFLYNVIDKNYDKIIICYETEFPVIEHNLKDILSSKYSVDEIYFKG